VRALFSARKSQETRAVLLMMRFSRVCVHFWPISGHFHSNPNFVDLPMTPLQPKINYQRPPTRKLRVICFLNCLYKWKANFVRHSAVAVEKKKNISPVFFDFPGLTFVLDLDPGFGCFSSRRVEGTYIYLPGLPKKARMSQTPFCWIGATRRFAH
jgi:hypothetical protein